MNQGNSIRLLNQQKTSKLASKIAVTLAGMGLSMAALAADPLAGTQWTTYDGGVAKSVIRITENGGKLSGTIVKVVDPRAKGRTTCDLCQGKYHNKSLVGAVIFSGLTPTGNGSYDNGTITDPENGKSYKMAATAQGASLDVRGYIGVKALGRTQTWKKS